jgi:hypothetical protein
LLREIAQLLLGSAVPMVESHKTLPPSLGNEQIRQVCDGVHLVEGTTFMKPFFSFPRTMAILETGHGEVVLVNAIRLDEVQEAELLKLGEVKHVMKIGMHDRDVAYYKEKFGATVYGYRTAMYENNVIPDCDIAHGELPPLSGLKVIPLPHLPEKTPECALLFADKTLITCDAIQDHSVSRGTFLTRLTMPFMGFRGKGIVGPIWKRLMEKEMGERRHLLREDMLKLTEVSYEYLITGHGFIVDGTAKEAVDASIRATFPIEA